VYIVFLIYLYIYFLFSNSISKRAASAAAVEKTRYRRPSGRSATATSTPKITTYTTPPAEAFILFRASFITIQSTGMYLSRSFRLRKLTYSTPATPRTVRQSVRKRTPRPYSHVRRYSIYIYIYI